MKKITLITLLLISSFSIFAQDETEEIQNPLGDNEVKINMLNLIAFKWLDVSYEHLINEEASFGVSVLANMDSDGNDNGSDFYRTFSITPYYRHFFSSKYARGFFVEAFTMLHTGKDDYFDYDSYNGNNSYNNEGKYTDFAVGISIGAKYMTKRGFVAEFYLGLGRDLLGNSEFEVVGRGGISIGRRF